MLAVVGDGSHLALDASGRLDLPGAIAYGEALDPHGLAWFEEPSDPLDFAIHAELSARYPLPLATGENLFSSQDARNLVRYRRARPDRDVLQFDPALSFGLVGCLRTLEMLAEHGQSNRPLIPHGGHQFAVHVAAAMKLGGNESYPTELRPAGGFSDGAVVADRRPAPSSAPGIGIEEKAELSKAFRELTAQGGASSALQRADLPKSAS